MNKLQIAHEYALKMLENLNPMQLDKPTRDGIAYECFELADAMQAEVERRKPKPELPSLQQTFIDGVEQPRYAPSLDEWQPDWRQAPIHMITHWSKEGDGTCTWWIDEPCIDNETHFENPENPYSCCHSDAPDFGYKGDWKDSLRKRP